MTPADLAKRFHAAEGIAHELGALAMRYFNDRSSLGVKMKGAQDWLTEADGAVETLFRQRIAEAFPEDAVMGEEHGGSASSARLWVIDPIDGTANFARGERNWCVSIAFVDGGVPELGILHAPALGETWLGRRGKGATLNGEPIRVAPTDDIARAAIEFGWSPRLPFEDYLKGVAKLFGLGASVRRSASGALGIAHVANGRSDAYVELHINSWDAAAGIVIAREAGATLNDFASGDWLTRGNPILVATPALAEPIRRASGIDEARRPT